MSAPAAAVVAIGGSDPSCGAGVQADVRTLDAFGVVPLTVVTAITVQDGSRVSRVDPVTEDLVAEQLRALLATSAPSAIKCGMLASAGIVRRVAEIVGAPPGRALPLVVDPVVHAGGGESLGGDDVTRALARHLLPLVTVLTCNTEEAGALAGRPVATIDDAQAAACAIGRLGPSAVVVKGGHLSGDPVDVLWDGYRTRRFEGSRIDTPSMHGTGCAFASALAAGLALARPLERAVADARKHVRALIEEAVTLECGSTLRGPGSGPR